ncbi:MULTISPECIES: DUF4435 domain-containing protein [unclassified Nodularia (in: cyanobacteria)]|uniref:DUF4435 domain-containing protein n=1 Tax=unclassified Nodularia (in: cyanobacteria) TaxID=2656917 RepID=UPI00188086A5|nr:MULTISPECIES: DUF4435 domain-containing protein [unclassified Nodularia (in: cyanobacteria)]MBE9200801.1 DUF4435 domain-containing protein [Nodularia sp. LEGE 06071]MCC2693817.1 DUF4435 domain-containing protein [Nodularia sp. LEGE 04288]
MKNWGLNIDEYRRVIGKFSNSKRLIVEGKTDKCFLTILLDEFSQSTVQLSKQKPVVIDDLDTLIKNDDSIKSFTVKVTGNRQKIERIHKNVKNLPKYDNLVFFVDREFRYFTMFIDGNIKDRLKKHKVNGSLIWSRGHSIENYLFDFTVLRQPLRRLTDIEIFEDVINTFENIFYLVIVLATAISMTFKECEKIQELENTIDWEIIEVNFLEVNLKLDEWKKRMCERKGLCSEMAEHIISTYKNWHNKIKTDNLDIDILRWLCHGHIGIKVILEAYRSCIVYCASIKIEENVLNQKNYSQKIIKELTKKIQISKEKYIWEEFANWWADKAVRNECFYPIELLEKLGLQSQKIR